MSVSNVCKTVVNDGLSKHSQILVSASSYFFTKSIFTCAKYPSISRRFLKIPPKPHLTLHFVSSHQTDPENRAPAINALQQASSSLLAVSGQLEGLSFTLQQNRDVSAGGSVTTGGNTTTVDSAPATATPPINTTPNAPSSAAEGKCTDKDGLWSKHPTPLSGHSVKATRNK